MNLPHPPDGESAPEQPRDSQLTEFDPSSGIPRHAGSRRSRDRMPPPVSDHQLLRRIGQGAYGEVWLARNVMGAHRAVKIVYRDSFDSDRPYEREFSGIQSFEPVSRTHESQVDILHVGRNDAEGCFYYVMELADDAGPRSEAAAVPGGEGPERALPSPAAPPLQSSDSYQPRTVRSDLKMRGRFSHADSIEISLALTTAVRHLHEHGLIHRDIKPANVIFVNGLPKLADIGLVTEMDGTMSFVGTEGYMPPEGPGSVQADIYSLGKTLYEVATGKDRLEFPELPTLCGSPAEEAGLFELNEVLLKACHPDAQKRYRNAADMHADLVLLKSGRSVRWAHQMSRRLAIARLAGGVAGGIAALAAGGYWLQRQQTREARRLAAENQKLAASLQLSEAEHLFETDDANKGVAYLARMLRHDPANHIAAARLMSALNDRSWALPVRVFQDVDRMHFAELSPDARHLVTCAGSDTWGEARVWDVLTGEMTGIRMRHDQAVLKAFFSPDGRLIATVSQDGSARLWEAATGEPVTEPLRHENPAVGARASFRQAGFSADGRSFVTAYGSRARVWRVPTGEALNSGFEHDASLGSVGLNSDGERLVTSDRSPVVRIWDIPGGRCHLTLEHPDPVSMARFSPDGRRIVTTAGSHVRIWNADSGKAVQEIRHEGPVNSGCFSPDGLRVVATDTQRGARIWDTQSGQLLAGPMVHQGEVRDAQFDATGEWLLTREWQRDRVWNARTGRPVTEWFEGPSKRSWLDLFSPTFSPDGQRVLTIAGNAAILWDVRPGQAPGIVRKHGDFVCWARFSPDGKRVASGVGGNYPGSASANRSNRISEALAWDPRTGELIAPPMKTSGGLQYVEFSPDGRRIATASLDGHAQVWDASTGAAITGPLEHEGTVQGARFSPDGERLVTISISATARVWDARAGQLLMGQMRHTAERFFGEYFAGFSPDGRRIVTFAGRTTRIWDAWTGEPLGQEMPHEMEVLCASFSPDGNRILTSSHDATARLWNGHTGAAIGRPISHRDSVWGCGFSPDGRYLVTASEDRTARIWDAHTLIPVGEPLRHHGLVRAAQFSHDSRRVVTASTTGGTARVWDVATGRPLTEPFAHDDLVFYAEFNPQGDRVVTASADGTARVWELVLPSESISDWLLDLAEAMAGQRLTDQEVSEPVTAKEFLALKRQIEASTESDYHRRWARWLLADRLARNTSLSSSVTGAEHWARVARGDSLRAADGR